MFSTRSADDDDETGPIKYTTSKAANWKARYSNSGVPFDNDPKIQPFVVMASLAVFMLYFFQLREENDIDKALEQSIFERRPDIEMATLEGAIRNCKVNNVDTTLMEERLKILNAKYIK